MKNALSHYIAPLLVATIGCSTDSYESQYVTEARVTSSTSFPGLSHPPEIPKTICETGDAVWATLSGQLSCEATSPDVLHKTAETRAWDFVGKIKQLLTTGTFTQKLAPVNSGNFTSMVFDIDDTEGKHHIFEIYYNEYEAISYLHIDGQYSAKEGYAGKELYTFNLSSNGVTLHHMVNGSGCTDCNVHNFKIIDPTECGKHEMATISTNAAYVFDTYISSGAGTQLACSSSQQDVASTCTVSNSKGQTRCVVDSESGDTYQDMHQSAPLDPAAAQTSTDAITASFTEFMHLHGVAVPSIFEK